MKSTILGIYNPKQPGSVILGLPHHSASFPSFIHYTQTATQKGSADDVFPFWVEGVGPARLHRRQGLEKCGWWENNWRAQYLQHGLAIATGEAQLV